MSCGTTTCSVRYYQSYCGLYNLLMTSENHSRLEHPFCCLSFSTRRVHMKPACLILDPTCLSQWHVSGTLALKTQLRQACMIPLILFVTSSWAASKCLDISGHPCPQYSRSYWPCHSCLYHNHSDIAIDTIGPGKDGKEACHRTHETSPGTRWVPSWVQTKTCRLGSFGMADGLQTLSQTQTVFAHPNFIACMNVSSII